MGRSVLATMGMVMIQATAIEGCAKSKDGVGTRNVAVYPDPGRSLDKTEGDTAAPRERGGTLVVSLTGTGVLEITDPVGRTIRYDPENDQYVSDIPSSDADRGSAIWDPADSTSAAGVADAVEIRDAMNGEYRIAVIGEEVGDFGISLLDFDTAGGVTGWAGSGATSPGRRVLYVVLYSATRGDSIKVHEAVADSLRER